MSYRRSSRYLGCDSEQNRKNKNSVELVFGVGVGSNIDFCCEFLILWTLKLLGFGAI